MKTFVFSDPNSSVSITVSAETEEEAREEIDQISSENLTLDLEEDEDE